MSQRAGFTAVGLVSRHSRVGDSPNLVLSFLNQNNYSVEYRLEYLYLLPNPDATPPNLPDSVHLTATQTISWEGVSFGYTQTAPATGQQAWTLILTCREEEAMEAFAELSSELEWHWSAGDGALLTLWDDVSRYYSARAYHQIHNIENRMRKLLTQFMLVNVGLRWQQTTHRDAPGQALIQDNKEINYFSTVDFIKLGDFLFREHYPAQRRVVLEQLRQATTTSTLSPEDVQALLPQSNWSKFFEAPSGCPSDALRKRWKKLYERRNAIAHNKQFSKSDADEVAALVAEVEEYLERAWAALPGLVLRPAQKETVLEDVAGEQNRRVSRFVERYRDVDYWLTRLYQQHVDGAAPLPDVSARSQALFKRGVLDFDQTGRLMELHQLRDQLVHGGGADLPRHSTVWRNYAQALEESRDDLQQLVQQAEDC